MWEPNSYEILELHKVALGEKPKNGQTAIRCTIANKPEARHESEVWKVIVNAFY